MHGCINVASNPSVAPVVLSFCRKLVSSPKAADWKALRPGVLGAGLSFCCDASLKDWKTYSMAEGAFIWGRVVEGAKLLEALLKTSSGGLTELVPNRLDGLKNKKGLDCDYRFV